MLKLLLLVSLLLPLAAPAPTNQLVSDAFCKSCVTIVKAIITNDNFYKLDKKFTDKICGDYLKGPMVEVCSAGILGEIDYLHDKFKEDEKELCVDLGCPAKKN